MLPLLVYVLRVEPHAAIAQSLLVVGATSLVSVVAHARGKRIDYRTAGLFGAAGMFGALGGARVGRLLPAGVLLAGFAVLMIVTATRMLSGKRGGARPGRPSMTKALLVGAVVGSLAGLFGAGGGFLVVPALVLFGGLDMKKAIGTSLLVIAMQTLAGFATHAASVHLDVTLLVTLTAASSVGAIVGAAFTKRVPAETLRRGFGGLVLALGAFILVKESPPWLLRRPEAPLVAIGLAALAIAWVVARASPRAAR